MDGLGVNVNDLIARDLLELPRHFVVGADYVEFGSNYIDMTFAAALLSPTIWLPAPVAVLAKRRAGRVVGHDVDRCILRDVRAGIIDLRVRIQELHATIARLEAETRNAPKFGQHWEKFKRALSLGQAHASLEANERLNGSVFCKYELAAPGRSGADMREMLLKYAAEQQLVLDRRDPAIDGNVVRLICCYLDARDSARKKQADVTHLDAAGNETINLQVG